MMANLFTVADGDPARLRRALADLLGLPEGSVDVADADGDQEGRHWDAPVLCTYRRLPPGDLALELDVTVTVAGETAGDLTEPRLAHGLAAGLDGSVLYPADPADLDLPSAYWVAVPDGRAVRCRLEAVDTEAVDTEAADGTAYRVDAVEEPVPDLPRARVESLPEVLDREPVPTPVADAFLTGYPRGTTASMEGRVHYSLRVWERLVRRLEADWGPSGRYREDLFRRDLESRNELGRLLTRIDEAHADALRSALTLLDRTFLDRTEPTATEDPERWWWHRRPRRTPWPTDDEQPAG
ncbi:hypothetical protein [Streptomyces sp. H51]|uniref:hypothetical protein n=1 Tax=Streptomyces sp. H51 TaxID=3111770 RepID=UPI002D77653E|nr:hypothetical protein [Streptomyces sp. H51]